MPCRRAGPWRSSTGSSCTPAGTARTRRRRSPGWGVRTALLGSVGADGFGDSLLTTLSRAGVDVRGVRRDPATPTAATIVLVHGDAERTFLHVSGANATLTADEIDWTPTIGARILHIGGLQLMSALEGDGIARVLARAQRQGLLTTLDTVMNPRSRGWAGLAPALPHLDWALPSFEEARALTGETKALRQARVFQAAGAKNVAVKMGADGCLIVPQNDEPFHGRRDSRYRDRRPGRRRRLGRRLRHRSAPRLAAPQDRLLRQRRRRVLCPGRRRDHWCPLDGRDAGADRGVASRPSPPAPLPAPLRGEGCLQGQLISLRGLPLTEDVWWNQTPLSPSGAGRGAGGDGSEGQMSGTIAGKR